MADTVTAPGFTAPSCSDSVVVGQDPSPCPTTRHCSVDGCGRRHEARGYCKRHYRQRLLAGEFVVHRSLSDLERFWQKVDHGSDPEGCWLWLGSVQSGYGSFSLRGHTTSAHRAAYEMLVGPIPAGLELDHLCRNKRCANPDHLEAVTRSENVRRDHEARGVHRYASHCCHGHEFTPDNIYWRGTRRECLTCKRGAAA